MGSFGLKEIPFQDPNGVPTALIMFPHPIPPQKNVLMILCAPGCYYRRMAKHDSLPETIDTLLRRFVYLESSHPRTWDDFYHVVVMMHARRLGWGYGELRERMIGYGLPREKAQRYSEIYWHCRCVLHVRGHFSERYAYTNWKRAGATRLT